MTKEAVFETEMDFLANVRVGLMPEQETELVTRWSQFEEIDNFLFVKVADGIVPLTKDQLFELSVNEEDVWNAALWNTINDCQIKPMESTDFMGVGKPDDILMFAVTNSDCFWGAGSIYAKAKLYNYLKENTTKDEWVVIVASVHELIVASVPEDLDKQNFAEVLFTLNGFYVSLGYRVPDTWFSLSIPRDINL